MNRKAHIRWPRLVWVVLIIIYSALFFFNFLRPFHDWLVPYLFTMLIVLWLSTEYYEKHLFFQSGLLFSYSLPLRAAFALFFYSSFVIGLATIVWWPDNRISFYPYLSIAGIALLLYFIYSRRKLYAQGTLNKNFISQFHIHLSFLLISIVLGYNSLFLIGYTMVIGLPLIYAQYVYEKNHWDDQESQKFLKRAKSYAELQHQHQEYIKFLAEQDEKKDNKRGKK